MDARLALRWTALLLLSMADVSVLGPARAVGQPAATTTQTAPAADNGDLVDLNTATLAQLRALPGMGAEYARRVIEGRPYRGKNQLVTRGVLPQAAYAAIKNRVVAHRQRAVVENSPVKGIAR